MASFDRTASLVSIGRWVWLAPAGAALVALVATVGVVVAISGANLGCLSGGSGGASGSGPAPSRSALTDIPRRRLSLYRAAGRRFGIDWTFLASIGAQECSHDGCAGDNGSGCAGPMQIAFRAGSPCSPGAGLTEWQRFGIDANGDGRADINDPADAIFTAARILRDDKGAPRTGASYQAYRQAACRYYGACADAAANYADQVMARAVQYGFRGTRRPTASNPTLAQPVLSPADGGGGGCRASGEVVTAGPLGQVRKLYAPRHLATLPSVAVAPGAGTIECDARILADVVYLTRRYGVWVSACYAIHSPTGEHPLGAASDFVPRDGNWNRTLSLARDLGWRPSCAASGTAPACARPPFRFIAYNGYPDHGDPAHCVPCSGGAHLHVSWLTSASLGEPENRPRNSYFAATWIEAVAIPRDQGAIA